MPKKYILPFNTLKKKLGLDFVSDSHYKMLQKKANNRKIENNLERFLFYIKNNLPSSSQKLCIDFLKNSKQLITLLEMLDHDFLKNYLNQKLLLWLNRYAQESPYCMISFFENECSLEQLCQNFIAFCFSNNMSLDLNKTHKSFEQHNQLSDLAFKKEFLRNPQKEEINLLGYGLDKGDYEKNIAEYLVSMNIARKVNIYGFDPYARRVNDISYFNLSDLSADKLPRFDVIIARWVLHHVLLKYRWADFLACINHLNPDGLVLIAEHGFLEQHAFFLHEKLYIMLNAFFDIIANIGLRPDYFTQTPIIGENFYLKYLHLSDFQSMKESSSIHFKQQIYNVGPFFPNQTICCMKASRTF